MKLEVRATKSSEWHNILFEKDIFPRALWSWILMLHNSSMTLIQKVFHHKLNPTLTSAGRGINSAFSLSSEENFYLFQKLFFWNDFFQGAQQKGIADNVSSWKFVERFNPRINTNISKKKSALRALIVTFCEWRKQRFFLLHYITNFLNSTLSIYSLFTEIPTDISSPTKLL